MPKIEHSGQLVRKRSLSAATTDRRIVRTRRALLTAFIDLILERGYAAIGIADIVERADIGRSTFYAHFRSKDELLIASMQWMFDILAGVTAADAAPQALDDLIAHFWSNRRLAQIVLAHPIEPKLRRSLETAIHRQLPPQPTASNSDLRKLVAIRIAAAQPGILAAWTRGEVSASQKSIADAIIAATRSPAS